MAEPILDLLEYYNIEPSGAGGLWFNFIMAAGTVYGQKYMLYQMMQAASGEKRGSTIDGEFKVA